MNLPTPSTRRSPSLAGRNPAYWLLCPLGALIVLLVVATPAAGQDESPKLRAARCLPDHGAFATGRSMRTAL